MAGTRYIDFLRRTQGAADVIDEHAGGAVHLVDGNAMVVGIGNQQASTLVEGHVMRTGQPIGAEGTEGDQRRHRTPTAASGGVPDPRASVAVSSL